jgi:uncharacterized protein YbjT (DUF2867 family)
MIVITGATGNTGSVVAEALLGRGARVRVIGRSAEKLARFAARGAETFAGDATDAAAMERAFAGATAAYVMIPPLLTAEDAAAHQDSVIGSLASGVEKNGVRHVVLLSSIGAQHAEKVGPIKGLHRFEQRLNRVAGLNLLCLRAGYFMENLLMYIGVIRSIGKLAGTQRGDLAVPMIAARDIGAAAAEALAARDFAGSGIRELLGPRDVSLDEAAALIGQAIGRPGLAYSQMPAMMVKPAMMMMGMSSSVAESLLELAEGGNNGLVVPVEPRSAKSTTPTTIESFIAEVFVPAFQARAAGA